MSALIPAVGNVYHYQPPGSKTGWKLFIVEDRGSVWLCALGSQMKGKIYHHHYWTKPKDELEEDIKQKKCSLFTSDRIANFKEDWPENNPIKAKAKKEK